MKHPTKIALFFLSFFLLIHVLGLYFISVEAQKPVSAVLDAPQPVSGWGSVVYLLVSVGLGTTILLLLAKYGKTGIWKGWFTVATALAIMYGLATILPDIYAVLLGIALSSLRAFKPNFFTHNVAELFMYGGIALLLTPLFTPLTALLTFAAMSVYDAYAVWKSKHMITLAEFTKEAKTFPGLSVSYNDSSTTDTPKQKPRDKSPEGQIKELPEKQMTTGILGGGDILFPLLVANTLYISLHTTYAQSTAFILAYGVSIAASLGLAYLFFKPTTSKYQPALPYIFLPVFLYTLTILIFT